MYGAGTFIIFLNHYHYSYLRTLLKPLNELADKLVEKLEALADGTTSVPMRLQLGEFTLNVISKVHVHT